VTGAPITWFIFIPSTSYDKVPLGFTLNLAVPVALVSTGGTIFLPDRSALKFVCCCAYVKIGIVDTAAITLAINVAVVIFE
jgi:hypothetical protein